MSNKTSLYRGDNVTYEVTVRDGNGDIVPLTGAFIVFSVKLSVNDTSYKFQRKNNAAGGSSSEIEDSDLLNGQFRIHIVPANTSSLSAGKYIYDIQITLSGKVYTVTSGLLTLKADVTT